MNNYQTPIRKDEEVLCYYCSMETFYNIVASKEFWLNDMISMNDPMENYVLSINFCNNLKKLYENDPFKFSFNYKNKDISFNDYIKLINSNYKKWKNQRDSSFYFSLCFSKNIDDLNMWRMYGDNGKGAYIAIKKDSLGKYCDMHNGEKEYYFSEPVIYKNNSEELKSIFSNDLFYKIKDMASKTTDYTNLTKFIEKDYLNWLKTQCFKYKLGDFASENEIRLVYKKDINPQKSNVVFDNVALCEMEDINIRYSNNKLIMYKKVQLASLEIDSICLGPQNNCDKTTLDLFLAKNKINCNKVYKSGILYR